jgi:predicted extracellular nuclease
VSTDNFANCIGLGSAAFAGGDTVLTVMPTSALASSSTYRIRVTSAAQSVAGIPLQAYTSTIGFTTVSCSASVVISQVYVGGGNAGATYTNDFIELHNNGTTPVDVGTWAVGYQTNSATTWTASTIPAGTIIPAGGYVLIQEQSNGAIGIALPSPTIVPTTSFNMSAAQGKVALVTSAALLSSQCPMASMVDLVQWGSNATSCFEGTTFTAAPANNTQAIIRASLGCTDTNQNSTDFAVGTVAPHTSTSPVVDCMCP